MFLSFQFLVFLLISFSFLLLLLIPFKYLSSASKTKKNTPPSPPKLPIIGNFHQLGSSNHQSFRDLSRKHGPLVLIHLGSVPVLVVSSAEAAREIVKTHDLVFSSRPKLYIPDKLTYGSKDIGFAPYGEHWRQVKSITVLHLLSNKRVQSFREIREKLTASMINMMGESCGSVVNLSEMIVSLTNDIICEVAFGRTYGDYLKFIDLLGRFQILLGTLSVGSYIPWLSWVDWLRGLGGRTNRVAKELDEFLDGIIEEHINNYKTVDENVDQRKDLVDILLDLQKGNTSNFMLERDTLKAIILVRSINCNSLYKVMIRYN
ncbi:cytochrome P450 [Artemisia annua]|uniref:Cytochrome P450 n=1 Tax=Artemisia annua TaxID=35608 RepID=A0A2U1N9D6_ARTAN|nr:cytochrome P450 [Artemisia annua]